jgi:iron complex outermembrane receptor protein
MLPALLLVATLAQPTTSVIVTVVSDYEPVPDADVSIGETLVQTDADGRAVLTVEAGSHTVVVSRIGFDTGTAEIELVSGDELRVQVELKSHAVVEEEIIVTATRTNRRIEDLPLRVEVVPQEEVQEKIMMTPGDISMLLAETNGLRVQTTSPSLGGASVRIQGLRGRYTQILSDGLPLFGGQTGAVGVLQIPPMDLGQVEVMKG